MTDLTAPPLPGRTAVRTVRGPYVKLPPHPRSVESGEELLRRLSEFDRPRAVDLFCGAGGLSLGLSEAGFDVILGVDNDDDSLSTHRAYHPGLSVNWDLGDPDVLEPLGEFIKSLDVQLIAGGPPCQPFSSAARSALRELVRKGARPKHDRRRDLWQSFLQIVSVVRPPAVLMENVPEMALDRDMWILRTMVDELEAMGYAVEERLVSTGDYGVPQMRHRLILVALAGGIEFSWPPSVATVHLRAAIGDLPRVEGGWRPDNGDDPDDPVASGWTPYEVEAATDFQRRMRRDIPEWQRNRLYDHITRPVREDDKLAFAQMDSTTRYSQLDEELRRYRHDIFNDKYNRLDWNQLSRTITAHIAKDGYWYIHPSEDRTLTVREAARIQTFPDHIRFSGAPSVAFRQIGNAVPVLLAEQLGRAIRVSIDEARPAVRNSTHTAKRLAEWFRSIDQLSIPWLRARNRWQVIMAELLWSRLARDAVREAWLAIEHFAAPADLLDGANVRALRRYAKLRGRAERVETVLASAEWFSQNPVGLMDGAPFETMLEAPGLTSTLADFVVRVRPGVAEERDEPVLSQYGVLRVASRFSGQDVERRNRLSDGRVAVARMIGGEAHSHEAHLALFELANSICSIRSPECATCPLKSDCQFVATNGYQALLPFTTPAA
jgi:DNA (cytosine-5)-methyltransferase 1